MSKLEDLRPNASVQGILPNCLVTVVSTQWFGSEALELTYKDPGGKVANELLYRHDEPRIEVIAACAGKGEERADILLRRLRELVAFLPKFEKPRMRFGRWVLQNGTMPYFRMSKWAMRFSEKCYEHDWILTDFDWPKWMQTHEAQGLRDNPEALMRATADQLARLLTVCIRQDRFVEGGLAGDFKSGLLTRILQRAQQILRELESSSLATIPPSEGMGK